MTQNSQSGLSLVEVLIVLAIVGVMSSIAILSVGAAGRGSTAEAEAKRLSNRLRLAMDDALVTNQPISLAWNSSGYSFETRSPKTNEWQPIQSGMLDGHHELSDPLRLESDAKEAPILIGPDGDGPITTFILSDSRSSWRVIMDGFSVATSSLGSN